MRQLRPWLLCLLVLSAPLTSKTPAQSSVTVDEAHRTTLPGSVHPLAQAKYDQGPVASDLPLDRLILTLTRPASRERALQQFLRDAHSPGSPSFHRWLTPSEFGDRFGALPEDAAVVTSWLESHGLTVNHLALNGTTVEFSGTAAQVAEALHTPIHNFAVTSKGTSKTFYANSQAISLPAAILSRVAAIAPINNLILDSYAAPVGPATWSRETHRATPIASTENPDQTLTHNNQPFYALAPEDFATQYNLAPIYAGGTTGAGQTIGIIGTSNINLALVDAYRKLFSLPADHTQVIVDGTDPGDPLSPDIEAFLDVEVSGSVAPAATVNLYISGGQPLLSSLALAALRAVEDNQASVLSVSYGTCEQLLGTANQFWNGIWQQAAAQGQTVFVSSGDSGPTTCTLASVGSSGQFTPTSTLSVNGIASTPWNVAVGGTDFYYSDYATGGASISTLWNASNDTSKGSLKAPLPEQPWDNALGLNVVPFNYSAFTIPSASGGGGVSNCTATSSSSTSTSNTCLSGYPKPAWQSATGVPADQARDLPDVSLFAANAANFSAWPICADPGDCTPNSSGNYHVFLVGGTSASSPAMAGVMALIDQKYGRQGQANFTLYALARKDPTLFHDITVGTNDVLCSINSGPLCATPIPAAPLIAIDSFGVYAAGPGYDLATGLGSIDAGKLFASWNSAPAAATSTSLQVSPTTFVHGASASVTTTVTPTSGSATPTGNTVLTSSTAAIRNTPGTIPLVNGTATTALTTLPGGTYSLTAEYSGDATFASSTSTPVTLTVTPEASSTAINLFTNPAAFPSNPVALPSEPYGSQFFFEAIPTSISSTPTFALPASSVATGTVTFTDSSTSATATIPLNANGTATWTPQNLALGAHSIAAAYSGDPSFTASTSSAFAITVVKGTAAFGVVPESILQISTTNGLDYAAGSGLVVHVLLRGATFSAPPSGTVTVNLGSSSQTATLTPGEYQTSNVATAFITFPAVPAGTYTLSATYAGDTNWNAVSYTYPAPLTFAATSASSTTTSLALTPASVDSSGSIAVTATVVDAVPQTSSPSGRVNIFASGTLLGSIAVVPTSTYSTTGILSGTGTIPATDFPIGALQVVGVYLGSFNDQPSTSAAVPLTVTASDFTLSVAASALSVKTGQTVTLPVALSSPYTIAVPITLACASPSSAITCSISPGSSTITGTGTATLTLNAFITTTTGSLLTPTNPASHPGTSGPIALSLAIACLIFLPRTRKRLSGILFSLLLLAVASTIVACGGSSGGNPITPPPPTTTTTNAPAGAYTVVVTATSEGITHNTAVVFNIQ
ncbi:hypothetical protein HDF16_002030 [Granulicella aggregans]|uniref:Peptidase S53 domain-containing protein n=1 Tax=Granulicella aggregans TaxID=474949 RepID=A0A7W7ZCF7_9BACT|nr:Ig-like domain repeat protein [Granulicella aggregans]MBB5057345.1 hypothetical protein [Granulicella aggregans]